MSIQNAGGAPDERDDPDDGFSPEERAEFEAMQRDTAGGSVVETDRGEPATPDGAAAPNAEAIAAAAVAAATDGETDDDGEDDAPVAGAAPQVGADGQPVKPPKRVTYNRYKKTLDEAETLRAQLAQSNEEKARFDERLRILSEALQPKAAAAPAEPVNDDPEPNAEEDIYGWIAWSRREMKRTQDRMDGLVNGSVQDRQAQTADVELQNNYTADAQQFSAKETDFPEAYKFLLKTRAIELGFTELGKDLTDPNAMLTPQEVTRLQQIIGREEKQLATQAFQSGRSPAAQLYGMAKARGYVKAAPEAAAPAVATPAAAAAVPAKANGNGAAMPAVAAAVAAPSVVSEITAIRNNQNAAMSLSDGNGAPQTPISAERIAKMTDAEFDELAAQIGDDPAKWQQLMGST